jgi:uncharacterized protein (UPF0335 family)
MLEVVETAKLKQIIGKIEVIEQEHLERANLLKDAYNEAKSLWALMLKSSNMY